jgi:hypothetical protein
LYRIIRHSGSGIGGFLIVSFYDRRDDGWQLVRFWQLFGHIGAWVMVSALDSRGRTIWIADAHRGDGQRFIVRRSGLVNHSECQQK